MILYDDNNLICSTYIYYKYYLIDLKLKTARYIFDGFDFCQAINIIPDFDSETFPFMIVREKKWISVINIKTKDIKKIFEYPSDYNIHSGS